MNTFIEEMATVFGWTDADYSKGDLLDYYRANVKNDPKAIADSSLMIRTGSAATQVLKKFVSLYLGAEEYMDQGIAFAILNTEHGNRKIYADFKTLALEANRKRAHFENDLAFAKYFKEFTRNLRIVPFITM